MAPVGPFLTCITLFAFIAFFLPSMSRGCPSMHGMTEMLWTELILLGGIQLPCRLEASNI